MRRRTIAIAAAIVGAALFAYAVRRAGGEHILEGIRRVGSGLVIILALGGARFLLRAECWRLCVPPGTPLTTGQALRAFLAGDAVGSVTPLGLLASEPTKVLLTRHHLATRESVASLALENLIYGASVVAMIAVGVGVLLISVPLPAAMRWTALAALAGAGLAALAAARVLRGTWDDARGERPHWRARLASVRRSVLGFSAGHPGRLWRVFGLDLGFHALAVIEVYLTLRWLLGDRSPTIAQAIVFEALNRVITVAFKFVPFRIGVDEVLSGALAPMLALNPAAGVALAVVRKVRSLFWAGVGLLLVASHPVRPVGSSAALR
jgi:hypothetical protein